MECEEAFVLVTKYSSIQDIISISSVMGWRIHQMDVKTTFLNEIIEGEVYIEKRLVVEHDYLPNSYAGQRKSRIHNSCPP